MKEVSEIETLRAEVREIREFYRRLKVGAFCSLCGILVLAKKSYRNARGI